LGLDALGAIWVRIWMSGMAVEQEENPNSVGTKLGSRGFQVEQMPKKEEKQATSALPQVRFLI
jgi:hypothetical protein